MRNTFHFPLSASTGTALACALQQQLPLSAKLRPSPGLLDLCAYPAPRAASALSPKSLSLSLLASPNQFSTHPRHVSTACHPNDQSARHHCQDTSKGGRWAPDSLTGQLIL